MEQKSYDYQTQNFALWNAQRSMLCTKVVFFFHFFIIFFFNMVIGNQILSYVKRKKYCNTSLYLLSFFFFDTTSTLRLGAHCSVPNLPKYNVKSLVTIPAYIHFC
jgi:hypothetical protein